MNNRIPDTWIFYAFLWERQNINNFCFPATTDPKFAFFGSPIEYIK